MSALFQGIIAVLIFGTLPVTIRYIDVEPFTLGIFRLLMGLLLCLPFMASKKFEELKENWKLLAVIGVFFGLHWLTYFYSIRISSASIGAIGVSTFGVHLLLLGYFFLGVKFKAIDFFAVLLALLGCMLLVPSFTLKDQQTLGLILSILSGLLYAILPILPKKINHISTFSRTFYQFLFALLVFVPFVSKTDWNLDRSDWIGMIYLGSVCTMLAHSLWVKATTELSPVTSSIIYYGYLPSSLVLNNLILHESFSLKAIFAILLIASANIIAFAFGSALRSMNTKAVKLNI